MLHFVFLLLHLLRVDTSTAFVAHARISVRPAFRTKIKVSCQQLFTDLKAFPLGLQNTIMMRFAGIVVAASIQRNHVVSPMLPWPVDVTTMRLLQAQDGPKFVESIHCSRALRSRKPVTTSLYVPPRPYLHLSILHIKMQAEIVHF